MYMYVCASVSIYVYISAWSCAFGYIGMSTSGMYDGSKTSKNLCLDFIFINLDILYMCLDLFY